MSKNFLMLWAAVTRTAPIWLCFALIACASPQVPAPHADRNFIENDPNLFFMADFAYTTRASPNPMFAEFFFFIEKDTLIFIAGQIQDASDSPGQQAIVLSRAGDRKCLARNNPPALPGWTLYQQCIQLISRTGDSFVVDFAGKGLGNFLNGNEILWRGRAAIHLLGNQCQASLLSAARTYANEKGIFYPADRVTNQECKRLRPPQRPSDADKLVWIKTASAFYIW